METSLQPARGACALTGVDRVQGELLDPGSLAAIAAGLAGRQAATLTREAYAGVYGAFCEFVGADAGPEALTPEAVRGYRDQLERHGRSPATIAKHLSALRTLASELGVERVRDVRGQRVARGEPRALTTQRSARLLRMPDRRSTAGKRDLALLHLLGAAGPAARGSVRAVARRRRRAPARERRAAGSSDPPLELVVGHRAVRQARPAPRGLARAGRA